MTTKKHTPSGAQRTTSARTTNRPAKPERTAASDKKKADAQRKADELTAERIRAILSDPKTSERVKDKLRHALNKLGEWASPTVPETPEFYADVFLNSAANLREGVGADFHLSKAQPFYERAARLAEQHEPKDARLVHRLDAALRGTVRGGEVYERIGELMNDLTTETRTDDLHPDIFPTLARVLIRETRALLRRHPGGLRRLREIVRELEAIADEGEVSR